MAFRLYALFLAACIVNVNSAVIPNEKPTTRQLTAEFVPQELVQQIPFNSIPGGPGVTLQSGAVHYFAPEGTVDSDKIIRGTDIVEKVKATALTLLKKCIKIFGKLAVVSVVAFAVATLAVAFTAVVCKHSGFCALQLHQFQFDRDQFEVVRSLASNEKLKTLTNFVMDAFEQYTDKQQ